MQLPDWSAKTWALGIGGVVVVLALAGKKSSASTNGGFDSQAAIASQDIASKTNVALSGQQNETARAAIAAQARIYAAQAQIDAAVMQNGGSTTNVKTMADASFGSDTVTALVQMHANNNAVRVARMQADNDAVQMNLDKSIAFEQIRNQADSMNAAARMNLVGTLINNTAAVTINAQNNATAKDMQNAALRVSYPLDKLRITSDVQKTMIIADVQKKIASTQATAGMINNGVSEVGSTLRSIYGH